MELEAKGYFTGWKQVGSVYVAQTKERLHYYKRYNTLNQKATLRIITIFSIDSFVLIINVSRILSG